MNPFSLVPTPYRLLAQGVSVLLLIVALAAMVHRHNVGQQKIGYDRAKGEFDQVQLAAAAAERARDLAYQQQLQKANHETEQREAALQADIRSISAELDRVRLDRDAMRRRIAELSTEAARHVADTAVELLGQCEGRYSAVAADADRCLSDRQTLIDTWPQ